MLISAIGQDYDCAPGTDLELISTVGPCSMMGEGPGQGIGEHGALRRGQGLGEPWAN